MYWEKDLETLDRKELERRQLEQINWTIRQARNSSYYSGLKIDHIDSLEAIQDLP